MRQRLARVTIVDLVVWGIGFAILAVAIWGVIATVTARAATVDGYAVRQADIAQASPEAPAKLAVVGALRLGDIPDVRVKEGMAVRVPHFWVSPGGRIRSHCPGLHHGLWCAVHDQLYPW